jgi:hypothetical protein
MKIILTERQYKILESQQDDDRVAMKALQSIWQDELDSTGEIDFDPKIVDYIGYRPKGGPKVYEMYRDFLGGWDKMIEKSYELMDRTFDTMDYDFRGGYDFRFTVQGNNDYEEDNSTYVDCPIESDGKMTWLGGDLETHLLSKLEEKSDLWWEVESEIRSLIEEILYLEVTKKTGILVEVNMCWIKE